MLCSIKSTCLLFELNARRHISEEGRNLQRIRDRGTERKALKARLNGQVTSFVSIDKLDEKTGLEILYNIYF